MPRVWTRGSLAQTRSVIAEVLLVGVEGAGILRERWPFLALWVWRARAEVLGLWCVLSSAFAFGGLTLTFLRSSVSVMGPAVRDCQPGGLTPFFFFLNLLDACWCAVQSNERQKTDVLDSERVSTVDIACHAPKTFYEYYTSTGVHVAISGLSFNHET